jgi:hypothetical protein
MPRIPILRLGQNSDQWEPPFLIGYSPTLTLDGLQLGIDNLRHDVHLSPKFVEQVRQHIARLISKFGNVEGLVEADPPPQRVQLNPNYFAGAIAGVVAAAPKAPVKPERTELKPLLLDLHLSALNRAKVAGNLAVDTLARVAIIKFLRVELNQQFALALERCRMMLRSYEGGRQQRALEYRERVSQFQVSKKIILRKTGQELLRTLREIEKDTLTRTRRSLFGTRGDAEYELFLNPQLFTDDGRDTYLNAENYVMLGTFDRDIDRFDNIRRIVCEFLQSLGLGDEAEDDGILDRWLSAPENAQEIVGTGANDDSTASKRSQKLRLDAWITLLGQERVMDNVIASYEVVPLLMEYSPQIHAQQLKNALISREERGRVEKLISEHGKLSPASFTAALSRMANYRDSDRLKIAARFLGDFLRYHRDLRRLEKMNETIDSVNLIGKEKMRELSAMNRSLYEYLLPEEQKPAEEKIINHVVLKADVRDSSRLTKSLIERGMNPASYFGLNFYDPVNKLLAKYNANKVFLEGDAIILALLEREGEPGLTVSRSCVMAREIIEIVRGYNQLLERSGLPPLELGVGISYQESAPTYLVDGGDQVMISDALNESDRLSSCSKRMRKSIEAMESPFNVYVFQAVSDKEAAESPDDYMMHYNLNGIRMNEGAFNRLKREIALEPCRLELPQLWGNEEFRLFVGMVPVGSDIFRKIIVRASRIPQIDPNNFNLVQWTSRWYYEVCTNTSIYAPTEASAAAGK